MNTIKKHILLLALYLFGCHAGARSEEFVPFENVPGWELSVPAPEIPGETSFGSPFDQPQLRNDGWEDPDENQDGDGDNVMGLPIGESLPIIILLAVGYGLFQLKRQQVDKQSII